MTTQNPSDEYIQRAYTRLRKASWEGGLEEALAHPLRGPIIQALARELKERPTRPAPAGASYPPPRRSQNFRKLPGNIDRKRLASGERDDD